MYMYIKYNQPAHTTIINTKHHKYELTCCVPLAT